VRARRRVVGLCWPSPTRRRTIRRKAGTDSSGARCLDADEEEGFGQLAQAGRAGDGAAAPRSAVRWPAPGSRSLPAQSRGGGGWELVHRARARRRTTARERRLVDSCPANRRRTATEQHARHECVFRSGCCPSGAGLAGRATIRPHLRTQHEGSESGQAGSRRRHNASGRDWRPSRRVNRRDGDWLTGRRARAARSGAVGMLGGRTASGRAGRGGTVPEIQSTPCAGRARRSAPAAEGTRGDLALCLALCQESGGITRTRRRTGREKLSASGAPTGSSQLSRFPARAALAGSVEARGRTAQLDRDRYRSFSVGRN
jgi:hypothetical protein